MKTNNRTTEHAYAARSHASKLTAQHLYSVTAPKPSLNFIQSEAVQTVGSESMRLVGSVQSERPMKVVHLTAAAVSGGIDSWMQSFTTHADPAKMEVECCMVIHPHLLGYRQRTRPPHRIVCGVNRRTLLECCRDIDVLLVSDPGNNGRQIADWIAEADIPLVVFIAHGEADYTRDRLHQIRSVCDHVVCVSEWVKDRLRPSLPHSVILNGIDARRCASSMPIEQARQQLGFQSSDFVLGFVGRFSPEKNPLAVFEALDHLPSNVKALFVGYGGLEDQLRPHKASSRADRVVIVDGQNIDQIGDYYRAMNAFVLPSLEEGFGLVVTESMMAGTPVIATRRGVAADLIRDGKNGFLIDEMLEPSLAEQIAGAVRRIQKRPGKTRRLIEAARLTVDEFGHASTMMRQYEELLGDGLRYQRAKRRDLALAQSMY